MDDERRGLGGEGGEALVVLMRGFSANREAVRRWYLCVTAALDRAVINFCLVCNSDTWFCLFMDSK